MSIGTIIITLIYLSIVAYLAYLGYRNTKTSQDYLIAGRQIHPFIMALSYGATFISTSAIVGFGGVAGKLGMGVLWLTFFNIFVGIFISFVFFGKRTRKMGHNLDAYTFPELLGQRYKSKFIQGFSAIVIFVFMPIYASAVLKGGVDFIKAFFGIPFEVSLLFFIAIVTIYVLMGGLKGVMYTDAFQGSIMFVGMTFLLIFTYSKLGGITSAHKQLSDLYNNPAVFEQVSGLVKAGFRGWTSMPEGGTTIWWALISSIVLGVGIGVLAQPQLVVRYMTVKSNRELNRAVASGGVFILMMTGVAFIVGALSNVLFFNDTGKIALLAAGGNDSIIPEYINLYLPKWFGTVFLISLLAAAMSTLSSQFHTMGTALGRDIYEKTIGKKRNTIVVSKVGILITIIISTLLTWWSSKLDVSMAIVARGTSLFFGLSAASFLPAYIGALYFKSLPKAAAIWGMISGFISSFLWIFFIDGTNASSLQLCNLIFGKKTLVEGTALAGLSKIDAIIIALPISILVTAIVWAIYKKKKIIDIDTENVEVCFKGI